MKVGTLSMPVMDTVPGGLTPVLGGSERADCIAEAIDKFAPDLLVCAGWSLEANADLESLRKDRRLEGWRGYAIVEVQNDRFLAQEGHPAIGLLSSPPGHRMYVISPGGEVSRYGPQLVQFSSDMNGELGESLNKLLMSYAHEKTLKLGRLTVSSLCCGELNVIRGRHKPEFVSQEVEDWLMKADIIVNPTHDRMGNPGTLQKKRKRLSEQGFGGRARAYISVSNWNRRPLAKPRNLRPKPKQTPGSKTLHTVYVDGCRRDDLLPRTTDPNRIYEYREINLEAF